MQEMTIDQMPDDEIAKIVSVIDFILRNGHYTVRVIMNRFDISYDQYRTIMELTMPAIRVQNARRREILCRTDSTETDEY